MTHTNRRNYYGPGSVTVSPAEPGEGGTRRCALSPSKLVERPLEGIDTTYDILTYCARTHGSRDALGWRDVVKIHEERKIIKKPATTPGGKEVEEEKVWKYFELGPYKYLSYLDVEERVNHLSLGLIAPPHTDGSEGGGLGIKQGQVWNIYAPTSPTWQLLAHSCLAVSITMATAYDTLGSEGLTHSLNEPECVGIFTSGELLGGVLKSVIGDCPTVKYIVYDDSASGDEGAGAKKAIDEIKSLRHDIRILSFEDLVAIGNHVKADEVIKKEQGDRKPTKETLAMIMYTSGSTGPPKGVCITHSNLIASVGAVWVLLGHHLTLEDRYLAYLPLAHVLEYIVELIMFFSGMPTGYGRVKTLTDNSVRNCSGDIKEFRPSIMVGVPAVWEQIRKGIIAKVNGSGTIRKSAFNAAINAKKHGIPVLSTISDALVLKSVREATGGKLRIAMSGGAAIGRETQEFLNLALVTMLQGYGMTETCGMCAILPPEILSYGPVGLPVPSCEIKLVDVPEAGYLASNDPSQGEICIRGHSVVSGYFKRPDLNEDSSIFAGDGWFKTGDVGQWNADGTISVIDRIKNLIKLSGGEYIALEKLESVYKGCNLVGNICVHGTSDAKQPIAIIIPHEANLRHSLAQSGLDSSKDTASLCEDGKVKDMVLKACNSVGKKHGFKPMEILQAVILTPHEWTPESGLVTAAQKIQRSKIAKEFDSQIKEAYGNQG